MNSVNGAIGVDTDICGRLTLQLGINGICQLEEALDKPIVDIGKELESAGERVRFGTLRTIFHAALVEHHPAMTVEDAGRIMTELGPQKAADVIGQAFTAAFPTVDEVRPMKPATAPATKRAARK